MAASNALTFPATSFRTSAKQVGTLTLFRKDPKRFSVLGDEDLLCKEITFKAAVARWYQLLSTLGMSGKPELSKNDKRVVEALRASVHLLDHMAPLVPSNYLAVICRKSEVSIKEAMILFVPVEGRSYYLRMMRDELGLVRVRDIARVDGDTGAPDSYVLTVFS